VLIFWLQTNNLPTKAELSPLPEPYNLLANPVMKEALDILSVANSIVDEVVDKLLNEAAEKILKED
jgi:Mg/Co/Ni transporter MgtE